MSTFTFNPRWKEQLVCTGPGGRVVKVPAPDKRVVFATC